MNKNTNNLIKIFRRIVSLVLAFLLAFPGFPAGVVTNGVLEYPGLVMDVKADGELDELLAYYSAHTYTFTSEYVQRPILSEYSQCFQNATWAANHANDTLTLNPISSKFVFDENYHPIGNASVPFSGTIYLNTNADDFAVETHSPIFDYASDSVKLYKLNTTTVIPLNINRVADVASDKVSPLYANHVVGSSATNPYDWKITLSSASAKSYSGVIYEMTDGAKVNLTFKDESTHTPVLDNNGNITSGSIIDNKQSETNYGILCGSVKGGSVLQATYTKTNDDNVTFIGTETAYCGGLVGEINGSTFELLSGSSPLKVDFQTPKNQVGFICGHAEDSTITLPAGYTFQGDIDGNVYAGGIAGYCKNTAVNYESSVGTITLSNCNIKNGTTTGGVFGYYECGTYANDILIDRTYSLSSCTVTGTALSGGIVGEYHPTYSNAVTIDLDKYSLGGITLSTGSEAGGLFGKYTSPGNVTITDSNTSNTHFAPPVSSVEYGGVIGQYVNSAYANTLSLSGFTVNNLNCSSSGYVGGVIRKLTGATYVGVNNISVTNVTAASATYFGGIVATLDDSNEGSFIDVTGDYTLSLATGTYKGGAIAGSFKTGVVRLAGTTDISGAKAANGYAQLVYENDETLVYAMGSGSDSNWTLKRNAATTASDLGQWGEVVRMFKVGGVDKNAEQAGIVSFASNKVTVAQGVTSITDTVSFAKCALNMQLNDGSDHGALCFADKTTNTKANLLASMSALSVSGTIDLAGTGLLGLMRDGGNGKNISGNTFNNVSDYFEGSVTGSSGAEIKLAVGEAYGTYAAGSAGTGGKIYLAISNNGHDAQGLFAFAKGAQVTGLKVSGNINVERKDGSSSLYTGALFGAMKNGATLTGVNITTQINTTKADAESFYVGGVCGIFDGKTTSTAYTLSLTGSCSIKPTINLYGTKGCDDATYVGGILGFLNGASGTQHNVSVANSEVSPAIVIDSDVAGADSSYVGGMIGRTTANADNEITLNTVTMTGASVQTKSKYAGGLLGAVWERTNLTVTGLTISDSSVTHKYSADGGIQSGLVDRGTGKWVINTLSITDTTFTSDNSAPASFGLIVNRAFSGSDGLYITVMDRGYSLTGVTVPTSSSNSSYYVDEIAADTQNDDKADILVGGDGTGIVNINMNTAGGTNTKITETGTYQNRLHAQLNTSGEGAVHLIGNQNARYYYNLDVMLAKGDKGSTAPGGEKFLLWTIYKYAAGNIRRYFKANDNMITETAIDLSGLSYYPIPGGTVTLPNNAVVTFGFNAIKACETTATPDGYARNPDDYGAAKTDNARNQHFLMQTGLFTTVNALSANTLTLTGDFGYVSGVASGALINGSTSGTVTLTGLTLNKLTPSNPNAYMLINHIDGTGTATPTLTLSNLRANNYNATGGVTTLPVAKSLFGSATGQNMTMNFSNIKLDARDGVTPTDSSWTNAAGEAMDTAYGTNRSIFSTATFFTSLLSAKTSNLVYNYSVEDDWDTSTGPRNVTYGKEITDSREYSGAEKRYYLAGETDGRYTNPVSNSDSEFNFSTGFLPYVANYEDKGENATYPVVEIKVNYKAPGITVGCGTYNDPYIISDGAQLATVAKAINGTAFPATIRLPNYCFADFVSVSWHNPEKGCGIYNLSGTNYNKASSNTNGLGNGKWTQTKVQHYLASAYYKIEGNITLPDDFEGIGVPNDSDNKYKGSTVFHGVIVGDSSAKPTIINPTDNPLIVVANGAVIKYVKIRVTGNVTRDQAEKGGDALFGYNGTSTDAKYYGGVIGEIMGGDNIIDDVEVTYTGTTTLGGSCKHLITEGGMAGCVVNGALIFRGSNTVTGRSVSGGGIYSNQFVGRVINGYAVYEKITGRSGTAPDNYNKLTGEGANATKTYTYPIDTIDRSNTNKLDVNYTLGTITVPDAQSFYILSLITQSIASTADTTGNEEYGAYSPSYGYYSYVTGVARLGDYTNVGCGATAAKPDDYKDYAAYDSINNDLSNNATNQQQSLMKAPIPYIIYRYTTRYVVSSTTATKPALDFPARKMTSDNNKFWDITLSSSTTFNTFGDNFMAFRGIGCVGINPYTISSGSCARTAMKVSLFEGNNNTINLHISLPRYERDQENYFHAQNKSLKQSFTGDNLSDPYGHDGNLWKLMGLGLFDYVMVNNDEEYQFQNFILQGIIEDKVYDTEGNDITGKKKMNGSSEDVGQSQLFAVGGVIGKRVNGNDYDLNFNNIRFDGLTITGAYSCGGLIGIDAIKTAKTMKINACNSTSNGISITGGYYGPKADLRHGIGSFVGMTFWCRPFINGKTATDDTSIIYVSNVTTFYDGDFGCCAGGLIGYTGSGAEIKNIDLYGLGSNPTIGSPKVLNAAGFIGFSQAMDNTYSNVDYVEIDNCTLNNISVQAKNGAAGFLARCGNANADYYPKFIHISNCAVIGNSQNKPEIKAYGGNNDRYGAGGFVADLSINNCVSTEFSTQTSIIENCYIKDYTIEGDHAGGIVGQVSCNSTKPTMTHKPLYLRSIYVQDCDIITYHNDIGGMIGFSYSKLAGYNLKIEGVNFKKHNKNNNTFTDCSSNAGIIVGKNYSSVVDKFIGIGAYHTTDAKIPTAVVKTNGDSTDSFFVWADYLNSSAADITAGASSASTFNGGAATVSMPVAPYLTVNPRRAMGTGEYLTGDGVGLGNAGQIYKDVIAGSSNRRYTIAPAASAADAATLGGYINNDGTYKSGAFEISTASAEFGEAFSNLTGVDDFAMLVINDDPDKSADITPLIKAYIRLVTNAAGQPNSNTYNALAYGISTNDGINQLYTIAIRPCYYDTTYGKFVLGDAGDQGLASANGTYSFVSAKADSESRNLYQFSLIDVQFKDPTTPTISGSTTSYNNVAYHLYVPVYTKKMLTAEFSAVSMSATTYSRTPYAEKIAAEIALNKTRSELVESTNEWTTTFIRYTYPKSQISSDDNWNFDKSIILNLDSNFMTLPIGTKLILVDPNANADKYYTMTVSSAYPLNTDIPLSLSSFVDENGNPFAPKNLSAILADPGASSTEEGHTDELYEDYYISIYVPNNSDGQTHALEIRSGNLMTHMTSGVVDHKANIVSNIYPHLILGDLFRHSITERSFIVNSGDGTDFSRDERKMTPTNKVLKTEVTATVEIKNQNAGAFLVNSDVYHAFYLTLTSHDADGKVSDIIYGTNPEYVHNTTTVSYTTAGVEHTTTVENAYLGANYVYLNTGSIRDALISTGSPTLTIHSVTTMEFYDTTAFPFNPGGNEAIGTQLSVKSSLAYREEDLRFSALNKVEEDPEGKRYYSETQKNAQLSFNAVPTDDRTDEIGYKTNNRSLLGVNGKYGTRHPIVGKAIYNVDDIVDYGRATAVVYTISLYKKVTNASTGTTSYVRVEDIGDYLDNVQLTDSNSEVTLIPNTSNPREYVYSGAIDHNSSMDLDKMFEVDFSCTVLTGDSTHNEYANYKVVLTANLVGATNAWKDAYLVYTNAKFDPSVIDE